MAGNFNFDGNIFTQLKIAISVTPSSNKPTVILRVVNAVALDTGGEPGEGFLPAVRFQFADAATYPNHMKNDTDSSKKPVKRPNILFGIMDDASYPHMSAYGTPWVNTPAFDRLAEGASSSGMVTPPIPNARLPGRQF